jgi:hypothetical protein
MRKFLKVAGLPLFVLIVVVVLNLRSGVLPYEELAVRYPVSSLVSQSVDDKPDQDRLWFPRYFEWKPYYKIKPLATFRIAGYVLGTRDYRGERSAEAQHSPIDFGLAWGPASKPAIYNLMNCSQEHRFLNYAPGNALDESDFQPYVANIHIVPENDELQEQLLKVKEGYKVRLGGYLVKIVAEDGWAWKSSTVRWDTGDGACELLLVTKFEIIEKARKKGGV